MLDLKLQNYLEQISSLLEENNKLLEKQNDLISSLLIKQSRENSPGPMLELPQARSESDIRARVARMRKDIESKITGGVANE